MAKRNADKPAAPALATLDDLKRVTVNVTLELADGTEVMVPMRSLSQHQVNSIRWEVDDPAPPISGTDKSGRPVFDYNNPTYIKGRNEAEMERAYRVLLAALAIEIPGETKDDRLSYLKNEFDARVVRQLNEALGGLLMGGTARVAARAAEFHNGRRGPDESTESGGLDSGAVGKSE